MQVRPRLPAALAGTAAVLVFTLTGSLPFASGQVASSDCDNAYDIYSAVSAAAGMQLRATPSVFLPVNDADAGLPTAQSHIGSLSGSQAFAGAPYSELVAGNLGVAGSQLGHPLTPNDVPVFSSSKYPSDPHDEKTDNPGYTLSTTAAADKAVARATAGGPTTAAASSGRTEVGSTTECGTGAVMHALADSDVDAVTVAGTLRIGNVHSHAEARLGPTGAPTLSGSMQVAGVSILGQAVGISDKGLVLAGTTVPLPDSSPLRQGLNSAGIDLLYLAAEQNPGTGTVVAPGLQITVTTPLPDGVGTGTIVSTLTLGQAVASVSRTGDAPGPVDEGPPPPSGEVTEPTGSVAPPPAVDVPPAITPGDTDPPPVTASGGGTATQPRLLRRDFRPWSIERVYVALALAVGVLLIPRAGFKKVAVRLR